MMDLYRLKYIIRYSNQMRVTNEDVAQHSFFVNCICIKLHNSYPKVDLGKMLLMATVHDWPEVEVDDISHKTKKTFPSVARELKKAERKVIKKYPSNVQQAFIEFEDQETIESKLVKLADTIQCIQYLESEISLGNESIRSLLEESSKRMYLLEEEIKNLYYNGTPSLFEK